MNTRHSDTDKILTKNEKKLNEIAQTKESPQQGTRISSTFSEAR